MAVATQVRVLVADSGAFIKRAPLEKWSPNVVTVKEVLSELRDESTRKRLQVSPFEVKFREPTLSSIQQVTSFAKKTGDYSSLSSVDLKVMALTHQLLCEEEPERVAELRDMPGREELALERVNLPGTVGFFKKKKTDGANNGSSITSSLNLSNREEEDEQDKMEHTKALFMVEVKEVENRSSPCEKNHEGKEGDSDEKDQEDEDGGSDGGEDYDSDDIEGWITPDNLMQACEKMGGVHEEVTQGLAVACVTTDFAMQSAWKHEGGFLAQNNVMLQMGLPVLSVEGLRVKQLRTYAKKCKACFKTTTNSTLVFCQFCGNKTLAKVMVTVGADGTLNYHFLGRKQFSHRGLRHSLPPPKGGRHANNPVLAPDQRVTYKQKRSRNNPLHPDYIAQGSPFTMKDVTSRGAQISFQQVRSGGHKRNPNAVGPRRK